jgi:hypothetical protein
MTTENKDKVVSGGLWYRNKKQIPVPRELYEGITKR